MGNNHANMCLIKKKPCLFFLSVLDKQDDIILLFVSMLFTALFQLHHFIISLHLSMLSMELLRLPNRTKSIYLKTSGQRSAVSVQSLVKK